MRNRCSKRLNLSFYFKFIQFVYLAVNPSNIENDFISSFQIKYYIIVPQLKNGICPNTGSLKFETLRCIMIRY